MIKNCQILFIFPLGMIKNTRLLIQRKQVHIENKAIRQHLAQAGRSLFHSYCFEERILHWMNPTRNLHEDLYKDYFHLKRKLSGKYN